MLVARDVSTRESWADCTPVAFECSCAISARWTASTSFRVRPKASAELIGDDTP